MCVDANDSYSLGKGNLGKLILEGGRGQANRDEAEVRPRFQQQTGTEIYHAIANDFRKGK